MLVVLVLVLAGIVFYQIVEGWRGDDDVVSPRGDLAASEKTQIDIFNLASPSVVQIISLTTGNSTAFADPVTVPRGTGSGIIWDDQGHIVTNFHVIAGTNQWKVTLKNKSIWNAKLIGQAPHSDLAVLKIDAPKSMLKKSLRGKSSNLQVGQNVFAIGNPYGLKGTYSTGVISGLERTIESLTRHKIYN
ncbi:MAG: serine protease, partial [Planctomycetes bacterium]|nr:serine protease [Planctomycetota bacterium]